MPRLSSRHPLAKRDHPQSFHAAGQSVVTEIGVVFAFLALAVMTLLYALFRHDVTFHQERSGHPSYMIGPNHL